MRGRVAACSLNQWSLDFEGNLSRTRASIAEAKARGCRVRCGPELELCGYGCEDHFYELDTIRHCWESISELLSDDLTIGILCDIGMPAYHRAALYNCRVFLLDQKIILIRPKTVLVNSGSYRESRYFSGWTRGLVVEDFTLPPEIRDVIGQTIAPIGMAVLQCRDICIGVEICEELWAAKSPHVEMALDGVELFLNGSGSYHELNKFERREELVCNATKRCGGVYVYSNLKGCDGGRVYFDGGAMISLNGDILAQETRFHFEDSSVLIASIDFDDVRSYRSSIPTISEQSSEFTGTYPRIQLDLQVSNAEDLSPFAGQSPGPVEPKTFTLVEEMARGPACWLWDQLRRSGAAGFFLPLSGGADSAAVSVIVSLMCRFVMEDVRHTRHALSQILDTPVDSLLFPKTWSELSNRLFHTAYLGACGSSEDSRQRASAVAKDCGSYHLGVSLDAVVSTVTKVLHAALNFSPRFLTDGGELVEDLALQNLQARLRMVFSYLLASLLPWTRTGKPRFLLVLSAGNVDECLRGYLTKYDCSSADLNPIGSFGKTRLMSFLQHAQQAYDLPSIADILHAKPSAELRPESPSAPAQTDEEDMGFSYAELSVFGRLRKIQHCGPVSMFRRLVGLWGSTLGLEAIASKTKRFFVYYGQNRHKMTVLPPAYHCENYSPDDNRFDHRPFLYPPMHRQFAKIDELVNQEKQKRAVADAQQQLLEEYK